jgi:hypothetical protein
MITQLFSIFFRNSLASTAQLPTNKMSDSNIAARPPPPPRRAARGARRRRGAAPPRAYSWLRRRAMLRRHEPAPQLLL